MTNILLISDSLANVNVAWRHFSYNEYNAKATTSVDTAIEQLSDAKPPQVMIYYTGGEGHGLFDFYYRLREHEKGAKIPLIVLADPQRQKALLDYIKMENTQVVGISVDDRKLMEMIRRAARKSGR